MHSSETSSCVSRALLAAQVLGVTILAAAMGAALALYAPWSGNALAGLALVMLWLFVELALGALVLLGSIPGKPGRPAVAAAVVAGFYFGALVAPVVAASTSPRF